MKSLLHKRFVFCPSKGKRLCVYVAKGITMTMYAIIIHCNLKDIKRVKTKINSHIIVNITRSNGRLCCYSPSMQQCNFSLPTAIKPTHLLSLILYTCMYLVSKKPL